ncbi:MAG: glycosyltransferase [Humidesulfovibrio sp.]|nr:glycosyltransferase [Humidesulfovibrio sp.]
MHRVQVNRGWTLGLDQLGGLQGKARMTACISKPSISIVMGSFNRIDMLAACIESIRNNSIYVPCEIIVIDGGSTDGSVEWLIAQQDVITIVQHNFYWEQGIRKRKYSWGYFMNIAFRAAHAPFICMVSDDCYLHPGAIMAGYNALAGAPDEVAAAAMPFRNVPVEEDYAARRTIHDVLFVNHGFYRADVFHKLGGFEEDLYELYKADGDYCLRLLEAGYRTIVAEGARVDHYMSDDELRQLSTVADRMAKDREVYLLRWVNPPRKFSKIGEHCTHD